ncbi:MAG: beta-ketoacyl-ACP synthase II [Nanoarchaeota archaeon]|nr:beta-ketoacyl-ACP synthase II [Nanoarchaeota archaeon]MBU0977182.1 beta-ketoacyl-ACP synthase II [Nanoarchaeota archaeon]
MVKQVVVTGMGCITSIGNNVADFTTALQEGRSGAGNIQRPDLLKFLSGFDVQIACEVRNPPLDRFFDTRELKRLDPSSQFAIMAAEEARQNAGLTDWNGDPYRAAVILGADIGGVRTYEEQLLKMTEKGPSKVSTFTIPKLMPNALAANLSSRFGYHGDSFTVNKACSSATGAMGVAFRAVQRGEYDFVITGGSSAATTSLAIAGFSNMKALTSAYNDNPKGASRPFDLNRSGFVIGEGAGILVFEELEHAKARSVPIIAEVIGYGVSCDAQDIVQPCETGEYAARALVNALNDARISPEQVDYINAHGTATPLGDIAETRAIKRAFGQHAYRIPISSTKSMHGHALGAAGGIEVIAAIGAIRDGVIPPTINLENPDPECDLNYTPNQAIERPVNVAISENFGFGGHNDVLLVREWKE